MQAILTHSDGTRTRRNLARLAALTAAILLLSVLAYAIEAVFADPSGSNVLQDGDLTVDASHADQGYIMAKAKPNKARLKLRVTCGENVLTYDLNGEGEYETFPLEDGSNSYTVALYKNVSGKKYAEGGKLKLQADMEREDAAFLAPNQYVNYDAENPAVALSQEICAGCSSQKEIFDAVKQHVLENYVYDFVLSVSVAPGQLPDISRTMEKHMGVCQDLSALTCCMLRVQGVPAKLMIGYADKNYHAWVTAYVDGEEVFFDPTIELNAAAKPKQYTIERWY